MALQVFVSGDSGIVSLVDVSASVRERARAGFTVQHLQSVEGEDLATFERYAIALFVLSALLVLDALLQVRPPTPPLGMALVRGVAKPQS